MVKSKKSVVGRKKIVKRKLSPYTRFVTGQMKHGKTMAEAAKAWKKHKAMKKQKTMKPDRKKLPPLPKKVVSIAPKKTLPPLPRKDDPIVTNKKVGTGGVVNRKPVEKDIGKVEPRRLRFERDIAMSFAGKVQQKFDRLVKASVLFGSQTVAKNDAGVGSDIDIILIVDDVSTNWDLELVAWYREELGKLIVAQKYGKDLHINTIRLSTWWEDLLHGDPVVVNILRYGEALIDYGGFFNPLKALLLKGKIRSTPEAVHAALRRAPGHIVRSKIAEMSAVEGVYWAMVDSSQAALMTAGKLPPSPEHIPDMLKEVFVDAGMLKMNYIKRMKELYVLHKSIVHGQISDIKGHEIDEWQEVAERFLLEMTRIIDGLLEKKEEE